MRRVAVQLAAASSMLALSAAAAQVATDPAIVGHGGPVRAVASLKSPGGPAGNEAIVTGGFDGAIIVWSLRPAFARRVLRYHDSTVNALTTLAGGCFASAGGDARIAFWCEGSEVPTKVSTGHTAPISALAVSPDGRRLASASWDHTVRLWPITPALFGREEATVSPALVDGHKGPVNGVAFRPDGSAVVSVGYDGQVRLTDLAAGGRSIAVTTEAPVNAVGIAPDGMIVVAGADGHVRFFDEALQPTAELDLANGPLTTIAISPDGNLIVTAGMRTPVTLIDRASRSVTAEILGPGLPVWSVAFSADGSELITGGADRAVRRWDPKSGKPAGVDIATAVEDVTAADPHPGARVFRACKACHSLEPGPSNRAGPSLHGIIGRRIASAPGYIYSEALKDMDVKWTAETIARLFEVGPNAYLPGTKMPEQTISDPQDRAALVDWLTIKTAP